MKKVAFKGGLLIDGTGAEPVVNSLVLTEDDKIAYAGACLLYTSPSPRDRG